MRICGMDEVGRGSLAGPLVAAATVLSTKSKTLRSKLGDSKKLNSKQRNRLYKRILRSAEVVVEIISARQINNRGMGWANKQIFKNLIKRIEAGKYIIDGNLKVKVNSKSNRIKSFVKADQKIPEVMAASIVAKVTRDKLMQELHKKHPEYGWKTNVGYGTSYHVRAIREHGTVHYHRSVFVTTALGGVNQGAREDRNRNRDHETFGK